MKNGSSCHQSVSNSAIREWHCLLKACVKARGGHFEHKLEINRCLLDCITRLKHFCLKFLIDKDMNDCNCTCVHVCHVLLHNLSRCTQPEFTV